MVTQEFLDEFNNSELGKVLRLNNFKCSERTLQEVNRRLNKNYTMEILQLILCDSRNIIKDKSVMEYIKENNEFTFDLSNINNLKSSGIKLYFDRFLNDFPKECNLLLNKLVEDLGIKKVSIYGANSSISFDKMPIEELNLYGGTAEGINLSNLFNLKKLSLDSVKLNDLRTLNITHNIESFFIDYDKTNPQTDLTELKNFKDLKELSITGSFVSNKGLIQIITSLENLEDLRIDFKENNDLTNSNNGNQELGDLFGSLFGNSTEEGLIIDDEDLPKFLNLSHLKRIDGKNFFNTPLNSYLKNNIVITSMEELKKLSEFDYFMEDSSSLEHSKRIYYVGKEPVLPDILEKFGDVNFIVSSPLVLDENFCKNFHRSDNFILQIEGDLVENYELAEISAINDVMRQIIDSISKEESDEFQKVASVYKKIGEMAYYDETGCVGSENYIGGRENIVRSLKGGLIEHKLVCRGYALVFKKMLDELRNR